MPPNRNKSTAQRSPKRAQAASAATRRAARGRAGCWRGRLIDPGAVAVAIHAGGREIADPAQRRCLREFIPITRKNWIAIVIGRHGTHRMGRRRQRRACCRRVGGAGDPADDHPGRGRGIRQHRACVTESENHQVDLHASKSRYGRRCGAALPLPLGLGREERTKVGAKRRARVTRHEPTMGRAASPSPGALRASTFPEGRGVQATGSNIRTALCMRLGLPQSPPAH